jgi:hypothetical protein
MELPVLEMSSGVNHRGAITPSNETEIIKLGAFIQGNWMVHITGAHDLFYRSKT